jgi:transposase
MEQRMDARTSEAKQKLRYRMVSHAKKHNDITYTAKIYNTTRASVYRWLKRYDDLGYDGLSNTSRIGQHHPKKMPLDIEKLIIETKGETAWGARILKDLLDLQYSDKTIHKKLKQAGLTRKEKSKYRKKQDMSEMRKNTKPFEKVQTDTKYLTDIPNLYHPIYNCDIPKYQFTARDYKTGNTIFGYSYTKDSASMAVFIAYVIFIYTLAGLDITNVTFQFDNGTENRSISKKYGLSLVQYIIDLYKANYTFIPVASPTFNSDVESFHGRIEKEFYDVETIRNEDELLGKAWMYSIWYNNYRKNRNKENKSPYQLLKENNIKKAKTLTYAPPIIVDKYIKDIETVKKGVSFKWSPPKNLRDFT